MALLDCKPLFLHTLEKLCSCDFIDEVYLDSESDEVLKYAPFLNYIPLKRDPALADNKTDGHQMFFNEVRQVEADIYIQILCTSPFIEVSTIKKGVDALLKNPQYDSAVLVKKEKQYLWDGIQPLYNKEHIPNSVDLPDTIIETMGLYIVRKDCALSRMKRYGDKCFLLEASPLEAVDINTPEDFTLANYIAGGIRASENARYKQLSTFLSTPIIADILDGLKINGIITGIQPNFPCKIMGRANTLKIRKIKDGKNYKGIYNALATYEKIGQGEIIIVENETPNRAYFGELNANLAIRSGAIGAIIGGVTRDADEVIKLGLPVFSSGYCCADVRGVAVMDNHNMPVNINGVRVEPYDLIFADRNGVAVIPKKNEKQVIELALETVKKEKSILDRVLLKENAFSIYESEGEF
jgi:regulator of RNase E activity RraA/CMP-N-acetylneuraminic acid synthetase